MTAADPAAARPGWGHARVRLAGLLGCLLVVAACFGWWLDSRVVDDDGFADVVALTSQRQEVRDYVADQATLRLARTSNFVSAARPAVTETVAAALATPPVEDAVRSFALRAHQQVFEVSAARRVDIDAQQTSVAVRSALPINPAMAKKLRPTSLDKLEIDNCVTGVPDSGLPAGPPIDPRYELAPEPPERCLGTGATPDADPSSRSTTTAPAGSTATSPEAR